MNLHRYSLRALTGDYLRAAAGLAITGGPLLLLDVAGGVAVVLGALSGLFAIFGARTAWRHGTVLETTADALVQRGPVRREIRWADMTGCRLDHFALRREGAVGWMQLGIEGAGRKIRVESTIGDFSRIAAAAASAAATRDLELTDITTVNFRALGLATPMRPIGESAA